MTERLPSPDRYHGLCACGEHAKPVSLQGKVTETERAVRAQLAQLVSRYDGALPPSVFSVVRSLQVELSWIQHGGPRADEGDFKWHDACDLTIRTKQYCASSIVTLASALMVKPPLSPGEMQITVETSRAARRSSGEIA